MGDLQLFDVKPYLKPQTRALKKILTKDALDWADLLTIAHALIQRRDEEFRKADGCRKKGDVRRAVIHEDNGAKYNQILVRMKHPAAIFPDDPKCCKETSEVKT